MGRRQPAASQAPGRSNDLSRSFFNHSYDFQRDAYSGGHGYHNSHDSPIRRGGAVAHAPNLNGQYAQAYPQPSSARPLNSQYGTHMDRHDFDYQQYNPRHIDDSETSSTAAVVGSWTPHPRLAPSSVYQNPHTTAQTGGSYIQATYPQHQQEPLMNHSVSYGWNTRPASGGYHGPSYQHGGHVQHLMSEGAPFMPSSGPIPTPHNRPQAWVDPAQSMQIHPPAMYAPAPTLVPTNYSSVPIQPPNVNTLHPAGYPSYLQPPANPPPGDLSINAIDQVRYPQVNNNENIGNPTSIAAGATRPHKKSRRGNGRGNGKERAERSSKM